jgi:validoxylamine A glucosyltransferase
MLNINGAPELSVIVPTYNRSDLLSYTLRSLAEQTLEPDKFEVVIVDDGSTDQTREVVRSFEPKLRVTYVFLERNAREVAELGPCVSRVRNRGASAATAPLLVFIDSGVVASSEFLKAHLSAHLAPRDTNKRMIIGYIFGTQKIVPFPGLEELLRTRKPEDISKAIGNDPLGLDSRHRDFSKPEHEVRDMAGTWALGWSLNFSLPRSVFKEVSGFDEDFRGWGCEDLEFTFRVSRTDVDIVLSRAAWAIEWPTPIDIVRNERSSDSNFRRFLTKHRDPELEIWFDSRSHISLDGFQRDYEALRAWTDAVRPLDALAELEAVERETGALPARLAVIGCGGTFPQRWSTALAIEFDATLLKLLRERTGHVGLHAIGLATGIPDKSLDLVVVTSRMIGLWPRWGTAILAEAHRIGKAVRTPFLEASADMSMARRQG